MLCRWREDVPRARLSSRLYGFVSYRLHGCFLDDCRGRTIGDGACPLIRWSVLREAVEGFRLSGIPLDYCVETIGADVRMIPMDDAPGFRERGDGDGSDEGGRPALLAVDPSFMDRLGVDDPRIMLIALDE